MGKFAFAELQIEKYNLRSSVYTLKLKKHNFKMKKLAITIIFLISTIGGYSQQINIDSLLKEIRLSFSYTNDKKVFTYSYDDETELSYYLFVRNSPIDTLIKLADDSNPIIRCKMFFGLCLKKADYKVLNEIVNKHRNDSALISNHSTDIIFSERINDKMQRAFNYSKNIDSSELKKRIKNYEDKIKNNVSVSIKGAHNGYIKKEDLLKADSLKLTGTNYKIVLFTISTLKGEALYQQKFSNNLFSDEIKEKFRALNSGDKLYVDEIKALAPDGSERALPALIFRIQ